jgi:ribosomal protein S18 acetylase RimI-like enzyme
LIQILDNKNPQMAENILALQKASYQIEADLIGFPKLPPMLENLEDIINSQETYDGYFAEGVLAGILSYIIEGDVLDIYKVAVHPDFFKRGIARQLLQEIQQTEGIASITVSTGLKNIPAVNLYTSMGFCKVQEKEVVKDLTIVCFEKRLKGIIRPK